MIVTDALQTNCLNNFRKQSENAIQIRSLLEMLKKRNNKIDFCWILLDSEEAVELNVEADRLAKEGAQLYEVSDKMKNLKMPINQARLQIRTNLSESWRDFLPDLVSNWSRNFSKIKNLDRIANFFTYQFITGHGMFNEYRYRFKMSEDQNCPTCPGVVESPKHVLFDCPDFSALRRDHLYSNQLTSKADLTKLDVPNEAQGFREYCGAVIRMKIDR